MNADPSLQLGDARELLRELDDIRSQLAAERELRVQLEERCASKDEFLSLVAHELRGPLGAVLGWAHMLRRFGDGEDFNKGLDVIEQSVQVQCRLIDDLLTMNRIASNRLVLEREPLEARDIVHAALKSVRPAAAEKRIRVGESIDPSAGIVDADGARLQQVLANLLANAVKFTPEGGRIEVALERSGPWVAVSVSDNGVGISRESLPHVFDRWQKGRGAGRSHNALGLGLAIARNLARMHGGDVEAHSDGEGCGATFTLKLPARAA